MENLTVKNLQKAKWGEFTFEVQETDYGDQIKIWKGAEMGLSVCIDSDFTIEQTDSVIRIINDNINVTLYESGLVTLTDYTNVNNKRLEIVN